MKIMRGNSVEWIVSIVFTLIGLVISIIGIVLCTSTFEAKKHSVKHTAVISDMEEYRDSDGDRSYRVYVNYAVDGKEYDQKINFYSSDMYVGKQITIYYNPDNPQKLVVGGEEYFMLILPAMGVIFLIIGLAIGLSKLKGKGKKKKLMEYGELVTAELDEIIINSSYSVNGRHPYIITCKWTDTYSQTSYLFKSENIWDNPEPIIMAKGITSLPVYIDRDNLKKYYVSLDKLSDSALDYSIGG